MTQEEMLADVAKTSKFVSSIKKNGIGLKKKTDDVPENRDDLVKKDVPASKSFEFSGLRWKCLCGKKHDWKRHTKILGCPICGLIIRGNINSEGVLEAEISIGSVFKSKLRK